MVKTVLKGLAVTVGAGLAVGFLGSKRSSHSGGLFKARPENSFKALDPIIEKLDRIEARMAAVEARPLSVSHLETIADLSCRLDGQSKDIESIREVIEQRQDNVGVINTAEKQLADIKAEIPSMLDSMIAPRLEDLRLRVLVEMQQTMQATLKTFERGIEDKVSDRMTIIEKALLDQSAVVSALSHRAVEMETNVQRMIAAVERLRDRLTGTAEPLPYPTQKQPSLLQRSAKVEAA